MSSISDYPLLEFLILILTKIKNRIFIEYPGEGGFYIGMILITLLLLQKRKWILAIFSFTIGFLWLIYFPGFSGYIENLGVDSLFKTQKIDFEELKFWLKTMSQIIRGTFKLSVVSMYTFFGIGFYLLVKFVAKKTNLDLKKIIVLTSFFLMLLSSNGSYNIYLAYKQSLVIISNTEKNFSIIPPQIKHHQIPLNLLIYLGESTSSMNMGLYGYFRNTTPKLSEYARSDPNLIKFDRVLSTHTHTSLSLLEALSLGIRDENYLPIRLKKRVSVVELLKQGGIEIALFSNQGSTGTWNQASSIIFNNAYSLFSFNSKHAGNWNVFLKRPKDHHFFNQHLNRAFVQQSGPKKIAFFHAYATHGGYHQNIPKEFRLPVDGFFTHRNPNSIVGEVSGKKNIIKTIEEYDSAMKYVDFSVAQFIEFVKHSTQATILIYFADHGDSVYSGRYHDSSRFVHEMATIPFILYFNEAAKKSHLDLYQKYKKLTRKKHPSTLAQLTPTILDLLGVSLTDSNSDFALNPAIGEQTELSPIVVREKIQYYNKDKIPSYDYIHLNGAVVPPVLKLKDKKIIDQTDDITKIFSITSKKRTDSPKICYPRAHSIGKTLRGQLVSDCIEFSLSLKSDGTLNLYHDDQQKKTDLKLSDLFWINRFKKLPLWIDARNLKSSLNCSKLTSFLGRQKNPTSILIEFSSKSDDLIKCSNQLRKMGYHTAYHIDQHRLASCSTSNHKPAKTDQSCQALKETIELIRENNLFSDLTFDYEGIKTMETIDTKRYFNWNVRKVKADRFKKIYPERFSHVIFELQDPNDLSTESKD